MSVLDLIDELRRRRSTLPIIVMIGHTDIGSMQRLEALDTFGFLEKPFPIMDLKALLARFVRRARLTRVVDYRPWTARARTFTIGAVEVRRWKQIARCCGASGRLSARCGARWSPH